MKIVSVNIERRNHLQRLESFLQAEQPDVMLMQEVMRQDLAFLARAAGCEHHQFCAMNRFVSEVEELDDTMGIALFSRQPIADVREQYYYGEGRPSSVWDPANKIGTQRYMVLQGQIGSRTFATTHAPVTPRGSVNAMQRECFDALLAQIDKLRPDVLTGDFNAPRGRESFDRLAAAMTDNIPAHYTSSIDPLLHRAAPIEFVVDGLFTRTPLIAKNVRLIEGVSDHKAVAGEI